jgi:hypothetical protein
MTRHLGFTLFCCATLAGCPESSKRRDATDPGPSVAAPSEDDHCPSKFSQLSTAGERTCVCPPSKEGKVWGSGIYTGESSLCRAAVHAGAIPMQGGKVQVRAAPGCRSYLGSTNNDVSTTPAPAADKSYFFPSVSDGKCSPE